MANYNNIKPYSDFAHTAAQHGGVESYLNQLQSASYDAGSSDTLSAVIELAPYAAVGCITAWECGKWAFRKVGNIIKKRKDEDIMVIDASKAAIIQGVKMAEEQAPVVNNDDEN